ncbi:hypothetical protein R6Q59_018837 [Mikania micrantha]
MVFDFPMETRATNARLEVHDQQIRQLQSEVNEIKTTLRSLEVERVESAKFRQIVLAWMKHQEQSELESGLLQRFSCFTRPASSEQDSIHHDPIHVVDDQLVTIGSFEIHPPSEQAATIQQSHLIPDYLDEGEDTVRPYAADGKVPLVRCQYWNRDGLLYDDGLHMLDQAESKSNFSFKANYRNINSRSNMYRNFPSKLGSLRSGETGSIQPQDRGARYLLRVDWKGRKKKRICLRWGNRYGPAHKCPDGRII